MHRSLPRSTAFAGFGFFCRSALSPRLFRWLAAILCASGPAGAAPTVLLEDDFTDLSRWQDLSRAIGWNNYAGPTSAFTVAGGAAAMTTTALGKSGYSTADSLKTFTCLDFRFPEVVDHASTVLTIRFRARWTDLLNGSSKGESNRFMVTVNHDYPAGGLDLGWNARYQDFSSAWWARPAYHVRLRGASDTNTDPTKYGSTLLEYGGGLVAEGEYERLASPAWWLAGFIASSNGQGGTISPGMGPGWPQNTWVATPTGLAATTYQSFLYVIKPGVQEIWRDAAGADGPYTLVSRMPLPPEELAPPEAPVYHYFPELAGVRLFWRAGGTKGNVFLDRMVISTQPVQEIAQAWRTTHFADLLPDPSREADGWGDSADPDGDGLANLQERFFGSNPRVSETGAGRPWQSTVTGVQNGRPVQVVSYRVSPAAADVSACVQWSVDLRQWSTAGVWETMAAPDAQGAWVHAQVPAEANFTRLAFVPATSPPVLRAPPAFPARRSGTRPAAPRARGVAAPGF